MPQPIKLVPKPIRKPPKMSPEEYDAYEYEIRCESYRPPLSPEQKREKNIIKRARRQAAIEANLKEKEEREKKPKEEEEKKRKYDEWKGKQVEERLKYNKGKMMEEEGVVVDCNKRYKAYDSMDLD